MKYLISKFECFLYDNNIFKIFPNVKYKILNNKPAIIYGEEIYPFILTEQSKNVLAVEYNNDKYYFLFPHYNLCYCGKVVYKNKEVFINLNGNLIITIDGDIVLNKFYVNLSYSHYEIFSDVLLIYFNGKRNFLIALKNSEVIFSDYYDEINVLENEKTFMCKLSDGLNHGKVFNITNEKTEIYLVYLDEEELNLKPEFLGHIFLDCVLAENFKYCNELLCEELKLKYINKIKTFFPEFDWFYPISKEEFILIKKNTLAGIYKFEIENCKISNITNR